MKGDFSRQTFIKEKHYSGVLMQQGRVQVDADWNEQQAIQQYRVETEAGDVIGPCGAPEDSPGFQITAVDDTLLIGPGRYYVDGILCENEEEVKYESQPDLLDSVGVAKALTDPPKIGLVYLDVWQRHITVLEDGHIREKALGGPDTATRAKIVWQVRVAPAKVEISAPDDLTTLLEKRAELQAELQHASGNPAEISAILGKLEKIAEEMDKLLGGVNCASDFPEWVKLASTGKLNARTQQSSTPKEPCIIPPGAGYRRLENQLYRVEIHEEGYLNVLGQTKKATFKWSRENGSVVTAWTGQSGPNDEYLTVASAGRDSVLGFAAGQWVELTDDQHELDGTPGTLVQLVKVEGETLTINPATVIPTGATVKRSDFAHNPKVRRWDSPDGATTVAVPAADDGWLKLEDGLEVKFSNGTYHTGDYWLIPARTVTGEIEWPPYQTLNTNPIPQPPMGIQHHYCRLALIFLDKGGKLHLLTDCRQIFAPLTGLLNFYYVGGDGQEAMPDLTRPHDLVPLAESLQVGVSNWRWPVAGASVLFEIKQGHGQLQNTSGPVLAQTGIDGIASCAWELDATTQDQQVEATLLDKNGRPMQVPIRFHANLSVASQVAFDPGSCGTLQDQKTVQKAIDQLSQLVSLYYVSGDGQEVVPDEKLEPLVVQASSACGPVENVRVQFEVELGDGKVESAEALPALDWTRPGEVESGGDRIEKVSSYIVVPTNRFGIAKCEWTLDPLTPNQQVRATLAPERTLSTTPPASVCFTANLSLASHVAYNPASCSELSGVTNVQAAIDALCQRKSGGGCCSVTVGQGGQYEQLDKAIGDLLERGQTDICICLMPGDHRLDRLTVDSQDQRVHIKIIGCGPGTRIHAKDTYKLRQLASFTMRDVEIQAEDVQKLLVFEECAEVTLESCYLQQTGIEAGGFLCAVIGAERVHLADNVLETFTNPKSDSPVNALVGLDEGTLKLLTGQGSQMFSRQAGIAAQRLAALNVSARKAFAAKLQAMMAAAKMLTDAERANYDNLARVMSADTVHVQTVVNVLGAIRDTINFVSPAIAVMLADSHADTTLKNNRMRGVVSLYGAPGDNRLTSQDLTNAPKIKEQGGFQLPEPGAVLRLSDNYLTGLTVGAEMFGVIKDALEKGEPGTLPHVYRAGFFTDNVIVGSENIFAAQHLSLTSNWFALAGAKSQAESNTPERAAALAIASAATYTGNHGREGNVPHGTVYDLAQASQRAANLLSFVP